MVSQLLPFRSCSIVALVAGSTRWLRLVTAPYTLSFHCPGFPSNTDYPHLKSRPLDRIAFKTLIGELLRVWVAFTVCSCGARCRPCVCSAADLFWESSAPSGGSGVQEVCVVVLGWGSGRRPRGWGPLRARGRSPLRRSGSKPSLFIFISE